MFIFKFFNEVENQRESSMIEQKSFITVSASWEVQNMWFFAKNVCGEACFRQIIVYEWAK